MELAPDLDLIRAMITELTAKLAHIVRPGCDNISCGCCVTPQLTPSVG